MINSYLLISYEPSTKTNLKFKSMTLVVSFRDNCLNYTESKGSICLNLF